MGSISITFTDFLTIVNVIRTSYHHLHRHRLFSHRRRHRRNRHCRRYHRRRCRCRCSRRCCRRHGCRSHTRTDLKGGACYCCKISICPPPKNIFFVHVF